MPRRSRRRAPQLSLAFPNGWGGRRAGAGRPVAGRLPTVPHRTRPIHQSRYPAHVTLRAAGVPSLREQVIFGAIRDALARASRAAFRLIHYSVQSNHVHLIVEASDRESLSRGLQGLAVRVARAVNRALARRGPLWSERYHSRALRTPRETRFALRYVLSNFRKHGQRTSGVDPCSSGAWFDGFRERLPPAHGPPVVVRARTWLARRGWRRFGLLSVCDAPGSVAGGS
jgi:REP element-mobilizing transposase RayT